MNQALYLGWDVVIGLEVHAQLATASKMFSTSPTLFGAMPNRQANAVDLALPGVLPVANAQAVRYAIRFALAVGAQVAPLSVFARKNYFYPDLPKGYQISQYEQPIVSGGVLSFHLPDGSESSLVLERAHLEEDAGKLLHENFEAASGVDFNRAGMVLLEIVSTPGLFSAEAAVAYAKALHALVRVLKICDGNMQEGSFRMDANVSVKPAGQVKLGTRAEIKNLNSFRFLERAIGYEVTRQIELLQSGGTVLQETRLYDAERDQTRSMRSKENALDYRYFPDPDLPPLKIDPAWIAEEQAQLPELPQQRRERLMQQLKLSSYDAGVLTQSVDMAAYFDRLLSYGVEAKLAANWVTGEISAKLKAEALEFSHCPLPEQRLAQLLQLIERGILSTTMARELLPEVWHGADPAALVEQRGLAQISDESALRQQVEAILAQFPEQTEQYRQGKDKLLGFFVGKLMQATQGKAKPDLASRVVVDVLQGR